MFYCVKKSVLIILCLLSVISISCSKDSVSPEKNVGTNKMKIYIGTTTDAGSQGIYTAEFDPDNGGISSLKLVATLQNPTFFALSPSNEALISISETSSNPSHVYGFQVKDGMLEQKGVQSSEGSGPCHVAIHSSGKWAVVSNYGSGSIASFPIAEDGTPGPAISKYNFGGNAHAHSATFDATGNWVIFTDLGNDKLMIYSFDQNSGVMTPASTPFVATVNSAGPRHSVFHPNGKYFYVVNELNATVSMFLWTSTDGSLITNQIVDLMRSDFTGRRGSADIHISADGKFLYASNRGDANSITIFAIDSEIGKLTFVEEHSCGGVHPRNFAIDPSDNYVLIANRDTNNIVVFSRDGTTGKISETGNQISISKPMCVKFENVE